MTRHADLEALGLRTRDIIGGHPGNGRMARPVLTTLPQTMSMPSAWTGWP